MNCSFCGKELVDNASWCPFCGTQLTEASEESDYAYEAFISYRHLPLDRQVAVKIQRAIEGYRIPKQLIGDDGKRRLGKCFRDEDELPTSASLSEQIEDALRHSRHLIVVCTEETRKSVWVMREVELFASYHGRDRILVALASGEPSESFPPLLLTRLEKDSAGNIVEMPREPIAADFRDLKRSKFDVEKLRIISQLLGCNFDDLRQREKARRNKIIATAASAVAAVSLAFGGFATYQQMQISESYRQIQIKESEFLATEALDLLAQGDRYQAIQVALAALPESSTSDDRPYVPAAQMALENSLGVYMGDIDWTSCYSQTNISPESLFGVVFSDDGLEAFVNTGYQIEVHESATGDLLSTFDVLSMLVSNSGDFADETLTPQAMGFAGDKLIVAFFNEMLCLDVYEGSLVWHNKPNWLSGEQQSLAVSPDGTTAAIFRSEWFGTDDAEIIVLDVETGEVTDTFTFPGYEELGSENSFYSENPSVTFSPDGSKLIMGSLGYIFQVDIASGSIDQAESTYEELRSLTYIDDLIVAVTQDDTDSFTDPFSCCIDVFDDNLKLLWSYEDDIDGSDAVSTVKACGTWDYSENGSDQLVVIFGNDLLFLSKQTGKTVFTITQESPILDCIVARGRGEDCVFICTCDGSLLFRDPRKSNDGLGLSGFDTSIDLGALEDGKFFICGDRVYCSLIVSATDKHVVYRFFEPQDIAGSTNLNETYEMDNPGYFHWNGSFLAIRGDEVVYFFDQNTFGLIGSFDLNGLDDLDLSPNEQGYIESALNENGDFLILGRSKSDEDSLVLYRIVSDATSFERILTFEANYAEIIDEIDSGGGTTQIIIDASIDWDDHVLVINPDLDEDKRIVCDIAPDHIIDSVWYANGKLYVNLFDSSALENLTVYDAETGDVIDCEMSGYPLTESALSEYCVSLSADGSRLAMACADGYLRCFDTATDKLIWETSETSPRIHFIMIGESGDIFVQDCEGNCVLVSGKTGEVLNSSTTGLPLVSAAWFRDGTNELLLQFRYLGGTRMGLALITMDSEMFGTSSIIYGGLVIAPDDRHYAFINSSPQDLYVADKLSLDELIELGHETVAGHELTDAERYLYQVAD